MVHVEKEHRASGEDKSIMMLYAGVSAKHADTSEPAAKFLNLETRKYLSSSEYTVYERKEHDGANIVKLIADVNATGQPARAARRQRIMRARERAAAAAQNEAFVARQHSSNDTTGFSAGTQEHTNVDAPQPGEQYRSMKSNTCQPCKSGTAAQAMYAAYTAAASITASERKQLAEDRALAEQQKPRSMREARRSPDWPEWKQAYQDEWNKLCAMGVFEFVDRTDVPVGADLLGYAIDLRCKYKDGKLVERKCRWCPRGDQQTLGVTYDQYSCSAPVVDRCHHRWIMAKSARTGQPIRGFDVKTGFPHAFHSSAAPVFVRVPAEFAKIGSDGKPQVARLVKSAYGLKMSGKDFYVLISEWLQKIGFHKNVVDPGMFHLRDGPLEIDCDLHVDDGTYIASTDALADWFAEALDQKFKMKHFPELDHSLGARIVQQTHSNGIRSVAIDMSYAIDDLVHDFGLQDKPAVDNPAGSKPDYDSWVPSSHAERLAMSKKPVKPLVGSLAYIAITARPDIAHAVNMTARYQRDPGQKVWDALIRILLYLKGTRNKVLTFSARPSSETTTFHMYVDASNRGCVAPGNAKMRSTTGILAFVDDAGAAYDWKVWRQTFVARNSTEAEIIALTDATPLLRYYRDFHREASEIQRRPTTLWCDNESTVKNMHNESGSKTGHLNRRQASSREDVREGRCSARSVPGDSNPADILTKSLPTAAHTKHADYILGLTHLRSLVQQD